MLVIFEILISANQELMTSGNQKNCFINYLTGKNIIWEHSLTSKPKPGELKCPHFIWPSLTYYSLSKEK